MVHIVVGNEPYVRDHCLKTLLKSYAAESISEIKTLTETDLLQLKSVNLFSSGRTAVLYRVEQLKGDKELLKYLENPCPDKDLIIIAESIALKKVPEGIVISNCNKLSEKELRNYISKGISALKLNMTEGAICRLIEGSEYLTDEAVNLYGISIMLKQLKLIGDVITETEVGYVLTSTPGSNSYMYINWLLSGDIVRFTASMRRESDESVSSNIRLLGLLSSKFRIGFRLAAGLSATEISERYVQWYQPEFSPGQYLNALKVVQNAAQKLKKGDNCKLVMNMSAAELVEIFYPEK